MLKPRKPGDDCLAVDPSLNEFALLSRLAKAVRSQREKLRLSVRNVATSTKLTPGDIEALEGGKWDIDVISLIAIVECLGINLDDVFPTVEYNTIVNEEVPRLTKEDALVVRRKV